MSPPGERLNRFLARRGVSSRRGADTLITAGRVVVNDTVAQIGTVIEPDKDKVLVDGREVGHSPQWVTLILNKPKGVVSTRRDPQHRPTVMQLVESVVGLVPVGRLDTDSRGLLLLTNDGELAHRLTHPRFGITKSYHVTLTAEPNAEQLKRLRTGTELDDGFAKPVAVNSVVHAHNAVIEVVMEEGRKREVRRMCAAVGLEVKALQRVQFGPIQLQGVREGESRRLSSAETKVLYASVALSMSKAQR